METGNECLEMIAGWMRENGWELAPGQMEALIVKGRRMSGQVSFKQEKCVIGLKKTVKYLGVWLDD